MPCLTNMQCLVAVDDGGVGWIIAQSRYMEDTNMLPEHRTDDNGIPNDWIRGLGVGVYKVTLRTKRPADAHEDEHIYVAATATLWAWD